MPTAALLLIALAVFVYAATARRLEVSPLTAPAVFLGLGFALQATGLTSPEWPTLRGPLEGLAEITLALVLFSDAARTDARALLRRHTWPLRTLALGLPLAMALGFAAVLLLLPGWPVWEAATLAAILAPTDAALGQAVVTHSGLPDRVRRALTVESGLNDGLALPAVLLFASLAAGAAGIAAGAGGGLGGDAAGGAGAGPDPVDWLGFLARQIGVGAAMGLAVGWGGGRGLRLAKARDWLSEETEGVGALAVAAFAYLAADMAGGNGFVTTFCAGLAFGLGLGERPPGRNPHRAGGFVARFLENEGHLLVLAAFLLIGAELLPPALERVRWPELALLAVSFLLVRPAAIWLSLIGSDAPFRVRLFLGWFGPRGLATALFALLAVDHAALERGEDLLAVAAAAVALSALLHGATAAPAARRWGPGLIPPGLARGKGGEGG